MAESSPVFFVSLVLQTRLRAVRLARMTKVRLPPRPLDPSRCNMTVTTGLLKWKHRGPRRLIPPRDSVIESLKTGLGSLPTRGHLSLTTKITFCAVSFDFCKLTSPEFYHPLPAVLVPPDLKFQPYTGPLTQDIRGGTQVRSTFQGDFGFWCGPIFTRELSLPGGSAHSKKIARFPRIGLVLHVCLISRQRHFADPPVTTCQVASNSCFATVGPILLTQMETNKAKL